METILEHDGIIAEYVPDESAWQIYANDRLVADVHQADWSNDMVSFGSEEAGDLLIQSIAELRIAFDEPLDAEMAKTDQGAVMDVTDPTDDVSDGGRVELLQSIVDLLQDVLGDAECQETPDMEHLAALSELEMLYYQANVHMPTTLPHPSHTLTHVKNVKHNEIANPFMHNDDTPKKTHPAGNNSGFKQTLLELLPDIGPSRGLV